MNNYNSKKSTKDKGKKKARILGDKLVLKPALGFYFSGCTDVGYKRENLDPHCVLFSLVSRCTSSY